MKIILKIAITLIMTQQVFAQDCKTEADLDAVPGKYLTAAQYPWPAVRAEYFNKMTTTADKAMAKQTLAKIEIIEQQSRNGFNLTGGNWENVYSSEGYGYFDNTKLGQYTFQSALYEYFCGKGKLVRNSEYSSVLRIYTNVVVLNTLQQFLYNSFGNSIGSYDLNLQYVDWKNHRSADVDAQLIRLLTFFGSRNETLINAVNSGNQYFQDVAEKDVKPNNRSNPIYRYWFIKKKDIPVLLPVSRKEYLQSLLEFYERERLYFPQLMDKFTKEKSNEIKQYNNWEADVSDKIAVVKRALSDHDEEWLSAQAVIKRNEDNSLTYKAGLKERTNYNRFWRFFDNEKSSERLYKYNPAYFKSTVSGAAKPQIILVSFRYVTMPSSIRLVENFTKNFDFGALRKMVDQ